MKIAITAHGENHHSIVDFRFVQSDYLVLYNQEKATWDSQFPIQKLENVQKSTIPAVDTLMKSGATILITGHIGPKAFKMLQTEKITIYSLGEMNHRITVGEALNAFLGGELKVITVPNALDLKIPLSQKLKRNEIHNLTSLN